MTNLGKGLDCMSGFRLEHLDTVGPPEKAPGCYNSGTGSACCCHTWRNMDTTLSRRTSRRSLELTQVY